MSDALRELDELETEDGLIELAKLIGRMTASLERGILRRHSAGMRCGFEHCGCATERQCSRHADHPAHVDYAAATVAYWCRGNGPMMTVRAG